METAIKLAQYTEKLNSKRQQITDKDMKIVKKVVQEPQNQKANTLVIADDRLHPQVVGIEASRVIEMTNKPTIIIGHLPQDPDGVNRGSGRSIPEFNMFAAMDPIRNDMISFGGHPMACGLSIKKNKIKKLRKDLENNAKTLGHVKPTVKPDMVIKPTDITFDLTTQMEQLEPCGQDNEQPLIYLKVPRIFRVGSMGKNGNSLHFNLGPSKQSTRVVGFGLGKYAQDLSNNPNHLELIGNVSFNHFRGHTYVQFILSNFKHYHLPLNRSLMVDLYKHFAYLVKIKPSVNFHDVYSFCNEDKFDTTFGLKVFEELGFIYCKNGIYSLVEHPKKQPLSNSKVYRKYSGYNIKNK